MERELRLQQEKLEREEEEYNEMLTILSDAHPDHYESIIAEYGYGEVDIFDILADIDDTTALNQLLDERGRV